MRETSQNADTNIKHLKKMQKENTSLCYQTRYEY